MRNDQSTTAEKAAPAAPEAFSIGTKVNVTADNGSGEGVIVEDFGELPDAVVDLGDGRKVSPRRFAALLNDGSLVFVNAESLEALA